MGVFPLGVAGSIMRAVVQLSKRRRRQSPCKCVCARSQPEVKKTEMAELSIDQARAILVLRLQRGGLRPSAAVIKAKEFYTLHPENFLTVRSDSPDCLTCCFWRHLPYPVHYFSLFAARLDRARSYRNIGFRIL